MTDVARTTISLSLSLLMMGVVSPPGSWAESTEKDLTPEKPASRPQHPQGVSEGQPASPKPSSESKSQSQPAPPAKGDSATTHKDVVQDKPASQKPTAESKVPSSTIPATKVESPSDNESKEKDSPVKKPLGSLILSVKLALMGDARLFRYDIEVEDEQQTVTMTGRVSTEEEKGVATEIAQTVQGVKAVVNKLVVEKELAKTLLKKQDDILTAMIKERFAKSATLKAANFEVKTEDGIVLLNGTVRFQVIALEAAETARQVPGVRAVNTEKIRLEGES